MFFDSWAGLARVLVVGVLAYGALVFLLRVSGNRTLSKMNAFDLVVTVALGSTLATILLSSQVALAEGVLAFALLIALQWVIAWASAHLPAFRRVVKAEPRLLVHRGMVLDDALLRARVAPEEIQAAIRSSGQASIEEVWAVVLETDGSFTVVTNAEGSGSALSNVKGIG